MYRSIIAWLKQRVKVKSGKKLPRWTWGFWAIPFLFILLSYLLIFKDLPSPAKLAQYNVPIATKIYDRNGILLYQIYSGENRSIVNLSQVPKYLVDATIAIEDKNFYNNQGFSITGYLRAIKNIVTLQGISGGSTITQQLIKSAFLSPDPTIVRKIKESQVFIQDFIIN